MTTSTCRARFIAGALSLIAGAEAHGQSMGNFSQAAQSPVSYRAARTKPKVACKELRELLTNYSVAIVSAEIIAAREGIPEHCYVTGLIQPEIRFEVNLPASWNGRLYMHGNGGFAGQAPGHPQMAGARNHALRNGFATTWNDTGHDELATPLASFAHNNHGKVVDFGFRAVHLTAVTAKRVINAYYKRPARYSYFEGCSLGGRQALVSAQRFPSDFNGIVAGAPVLNTGMAGIWQGKALLEAPIALEKTGIIADAVYRKCDALDGLADGILEDPRRCAFDPVTDLPVCSGSEEGPDCFTTAQIGALKKIYGGVISKGKLIFPGPPVGAEAVGLQGVPPLGPPGHKVSGWEYWLIGKSGSSQSLAFAESALRYLAFEKDDPAFEWKNFDFDRDFDRMGRSEQAYSSARNPDLSGFKSRGGKLLMYHGWSDTSLNPLISVDYYEKAAALAGPSTKSFFRMFMVPGMFHCMGGTGVDQFDRMTALVNWVEKGIAPDRIVGASIENGAVRLTRPLCPYPQVARYKGSGNANDAGNFACVNP